MYIDSGSGQVSVVSGCVCVYSGSHKWCFELL